MATLFVVDHDHDGIFVFSRLAPGEAEVVGDVSLAVRPGEEAMGLTYSEWSKIAETTGRINSEFLPGNE